MTGLRVGMGIVFFWFGALKIVGLGPVDSLIKETLFWWDPSITVPLIGIVEVFISFVFFIPVLLKWFFWIIILHMLGTFSPLIMSPDLMYVDNNVFNLSMEGEFVVKNLVLLPASIVIYLYYRR